jgi:CHAT domain-containing protein
MIRRFLCLLLINLFTLSWNSTLAQPLERATQAFQQGYYEQAIKQWQIALAHLPTAQQRLQVELGIVQAYRRLGAYDQAIKVLNQALPLAKSTETIYYVLLLNEQSKLYFSQEPTKPKKAISLVTTALQLARNTYHPWVLASVLNHWSNMLTVQGDYESALNSYREALNHLQVYQQAVNAATSSTPIPFSPLFSPSATATLSGKILINQARTTLLIESDNTFQSTDPQLAFQGSITALTTAWQATQQWGDSYSQIFGLLALSQLAQQIQAQLAKPITHLNQLIDQTLKLAQTLAQQLAHPTAKAYVYGYLGKRYEQTHHLEEALAFTRQALFFAQQTQTKSLLYYWQWQLGRLLKARGDRPGAINAYQQAVANLTPIRLPVATMGYINLEESFRERVAPVYFELADLLLQESHSTHSSTQRQPLLQQARNTIELFKQAELQDYFQWDCADTKTNCTEVEQLLDPHTAILYPIPLPDRLELLLNLSHDLVQITVPIKESILRDTIATFLSPLRQHPNPEEQARSSNSSETRTAICKPSTRGSIAQNLNASVQTFLQPAQILYRWLIEPLAKYLDNIDTLVIVPDGVLYTIPFAALHDGQQFLIQKYALASVPSLCLSQSQLNRPFSRHILLGGLSKSVQGFSALPCAEYELKTVQALFKTAPQPLLNEKFTFPALQRSLNQTTFSTVHIASHGQFSANLDNTFILTYDDKLTMDKLERLMSLATIQGNPVDLLTLSACETAVGNERAALGLAGVALRAGVNSAVASLWQVDDEATPAVIIEFYSQLHNLSLSKAKALQQAQIRMLTDKNYVRYQHPYYWSAFLLIGNWL